MSHIKEIIGHLPNEIGKINYQGKLNIEKIKEIDTANMYQLLTNYGKLIKDAIDNAISLEIDKNYYLDSKIKRIFILGIGGSAMAGELLKSYLEYICRSNRLEINVIRGTSIPSDINKDVLVFCCSYSGNTDETLEALEYVKQFNTNIIAITSGGKLSEIAEKEGFKLLKLPTGFMPRCAMFYSFFHLLHTLAALNLIEESTENIIKHSIKSIVTTEFCNSLDYSAINNNNIALVLARLCERKIPIIYTGDERLKAVNLRWRAQIQENANQLCFGNYFPELNHNEINSWMLPANLLNEFIIIAMKDIEDSNNLNIAIDKGLNILRKKEIQVVEVVVAGDTLLERIIRLICIADWFSFYLAIINNIDPTPIPLITELKKIK
ncbi:MAG: SIS domain-containing protein [Bacteroidetes bacterium]|nr:SIS domain-containing protein [Bacteroidota bacterium]